MSVSMLRPFFISVAGVVVIVLVNDYLAAINYFVPVDAFVTIGSAWLLAVVPWVVSQFAISGVKILGEWIPFT